MEPPGKVIAPDLSLNEVRDIIAKYALDYVLVVENDNTLVGVIETKMLSRFISTKMIEAQRKAEALG